MISLLNKLETDYPKLNFIPGDLYSWSPQDRSIIYVANPTNSEKSNWSLLHEVGHSLLKHQSYASDIELIKLESEAWEKAVQLGKKYKIEIDDNHIQDCMDTYRDWLHQRSACPTCNNHSIQQDSQTYNCFNCGQSWIVSSSRFCRPYRLKKSINNKSSQSKSPRATFA